MWRQCLPFVCLLLLPASLSAHDISFRHDPASEKIVSAWVDDNLDSLLETYRHLHANPELSLMEEQTAALVSKQLKAAGFSVQDGVGGHGVVAVLKNGKGPTLMIRGDMDALPVTEETGLPYASKLQAKREDGRIVGVMHACGHDIHTTNLLGVAKLLSEHRQLWAGTLVIVAQPAEELGSGARSMMDDGLFRRAPRPDYTLALHVSADLMAGKVGYVSGWAAANVDSVDITVYGRGGHGARPHQSNDPIVTAAHMVTSLQSIVSRRVDPQAPAVVTVGSIHGGAKHNVIPNEVHLQLTVRSYSDEVRRVLLDGIRQIAVDTCRTFACPKPPRIFVKKHYTPAVYNDPTLAAVAGEVFGAVLGKEALAERKPTMGGEDFGRYARKLGVPGLLFRLGAVAPRTWRASLKRGGAPLPTLHSSLFAPDARRSLSTGLRAMTHLALALLPKAP